jgi:peptide/nickel transport system permease protein
MLAYITRRILFSIPVLLVSTFVAFFSVRLAFDPTVKFRLLRDPLAVQRAIKNFGLDRPMPVQWWKWLTRAIRGDLGVSTRTSGAVWPDVVSALGNTVQLIFWGLLLALVLAVIIGVYSATRQYSMGDYLFTGLSYVGVAMPPFWFGLIMIQIFGVYAKNHWGFQLFFVGLHSTGKSGINLDYIKHLILPVCTLAVQLVAQWSRFQRAALLDVLSSEYVRTARAKGLSRRQVIWKHAFRNALTPLVTDVATNAGALFGGLVITETIFSIPGMGRYTLLSIQTGDVYGVIAAMAVAGLFVILFNLLADLLYGVLDPRVRLA